jgi:AbrB family looped-hinge helix DNA binding protein
LGTARGLVRRIDDLGRVVIPKEIRRTLRIREGEPLHTTLTLFDNFCFGVHSFVKRETAE